MSEATYEVEIKKMQTDPAHCPIGAGPWVSYSMGKVGLDRAKHIASIASEVYVHVRVVKTKIEKEVIAWQGS